jgi:hypothetical protein
MYQPCLAAPCREAGGVEAALGLLEAARQQQPAVRELPRDEEAAEAAGTALHALLVLLTGAHQTRRVVPFAVGLLFS